MTLRWRLTLLYTALLAALLLIVMLVVLGALQRSLNGSVQRELENSLEQVITRGPQTAEIFGLNGNAPIYPDIYYQLDIYPGETLSAVKSFTGGELVPALTIAQSHAISGQAKIQLKPRQYLRLIHSPSGQIFANTTVTLSGQVHPLRVLAALGTFKPPVPHLPQSTAVVYLAKDLTSQDQTLQQLELIMVVVSGFALLGMGAGAYALAERALKPLAEVREAAAQISEKTLRKRVPEPNSHDEVADLAHTLNRMLDRLEQSFEVQRRFTADASHELRTPVTAIGGHASYLLRRTQVSAQQTESLQVIHNESERLSQLISSLLDLARADSGSSPVNPEPMLAQAFLADIATELEPIRGSCQISVTGQEVEFEGDPGRLRQVLINLVGNALKAGASRVVLGSEVQSGWVHLSVADNGPGIPPEHLGRIFERFYRVEQSRSRDAGGNGLGLSIAKAIVDAHRGEIWITSVVGGGTTAHVRLPLDGSGRPS